MPGVGFTMSTSAANAQAIIADLERDGYVVVKSFLDKELVEEARRDLEAIYAKDLEERRMRNMDEQLFTHGSTKSILSEHPISSSACPARAKHWINATRRSFPIR